MSAIRTFSLALLLGASLAACADREQDPAKADFFSTVGNIATGTYDRRQEERKEELARAESDRNQAATSASASRSEMERLAAERSQRERELTQLQASTRRLQQEIARNRSRRDLSAERVRQLERDVAALRSEEDRLRAMGPSANQREVDAARQRHAELERAWHDLVKTPVRRE
jgi:chromosome segregation ATPase